VFGSIEVTRRGEKRLVMPVGPNTAGTERLGEGVLVAEALQGKRGEMTTLLAYHRVSGKSDSVYVEGLVRLIGNCDGGVAVRVTDGGAETLHYCVPTSSLLVTLSSPQAAEKRGRL